MVSARGRQKKKTLLNEKKESAAEEGMAAPQAPSSGPEASGATGAALLASQLETLRERQLALLRVLQSRNLADADASAAAETAFAQVPEYADRLRRVQEDMRKLASRTADMRKRSAALSGTYDSGS